MEKGLNQHNFMPGTERYTRPEEVKALNKFLKSIREIQEEHTEISEDNLMLPGSKDSSGQPFLPKVDKLENRRISVEGNVEEVDLSNSKIILKDKREQKLNDEKLNLENSKKDISLENHKETIKEKNIEELLREKLTIKSNDDMTLENEILTLNYQEVSNLSESKFYITPEEINKLINTSDKLKDDREIDLETDKETIEGKEISKLPDSSLEINKNEINSLEDEKISISPVEIDNLENNKIKISEKPVENLEESILNLEKKDIDTLEKKTLNITPREVENLGDTKASISPVEIEKLEDRVIKVEEKEVTNLDESVLRIESKELDNLELEILKISENKTENLRENIETITPSEIPELSKSKFEISEKPVENLEESILNLEKKDIDTLEKEILNITPREVENLEKEKINISKKELSELEDTKISISPVETEKLEDKVLKVEEKEITELVDHQEKISPESDIELSSTKLNISPITVSELPEDKKTIENSNEISSLDNTKLEINSEEELNLEDEVLKLTGIKEIDLSPERIDITPSQSIELDNKKIEIDVEENLSLEDIILDIEDNRENKLSEIIIEGPKKTDLDDLRQNKETISPEENIDLEDKIVNLKGTTELESLQETFIPISDSREIDLPENSEKLNASKEIDLETRKISINKPEDLELSEKTEKLNIDDRELELEDSLIKVYDDREIELTENLENLIKNEDIDLDNRRVSLDVEELKILPGEGFISTMPRNVSEEKEEDKFEELHNNTFPEEFREKFGETENRPDHSEDKTITNGDYKEQYDDLQNLSSEEFLQKYRTKSTERPDNASLLDRTIVDLNDIVKDKDYIEKYSELSGKSKDELTEEDYENFRKEFMENSVDRPENEFHYRKSDNLSDKYEEARDKIERGKIIRPEHYRNEGEYIDLDNVDDPNIFRENQEKRELPENVEHTRSSENLSNKYKEAKGKISNDKVSRPRNTNREVSNISKIGDLDAKEKNRGHKKGNGYVIPTSKLPEMGFKRFWSGNGLNVSTYLRWAVENTVGRIPLKGAAKKTLVDETLALLVLGREKLEKVAKSNRDRLPGGDLGLLSDLANGTLSLKSATKSVVSAVGEVLLKNSVDRSEPINRPKPVNKLGDKKTTQWEAPGQYVQDYRQDKSNTDKEGSGGFFKEVGNSLIGKSNNNLSKEEIRTFGDLVDMKFSIPEDNGIESIGIGKTLEDLVFAGNTILNYDDFKHALRMSGNITTPEKFTSTRNSTVYTTLDSNHIWEIIIRPYTGILNGGCTWLPCFAEMDFRNKSAFNLSTRYYKGWLPITGFELQEKKLTSKELPLFDGSISYPVGIEFTNELRITFADDSLKTLKRYFDLCTKVSAYMSNIHYKVEEPYYSDDRKNLLGERVSSYKITPTVFLEGKVHPGLYKNLSFLITIYILTPQYGTIKKCNLLCVIKDYTIENQGEIDSSPTELNVTFSIVGENPPESLDLKFNTFYKAVNKRKVDDRTGTGILELGNSGNLSIF